MGSIPGSGRYPGKGNGNPVFMPGKSHGQRSLVGCSPWVCKKSDMSEGLNHTSQEVVSGCQELGGGWGQGEEYAEHRGFSGQCNYSVCY